MHREASTRNGVIALVGQASMHRVQDPQGSFPRRAGVGVRGSVVTTAPSSIQLPTPG